MPATRVRDADTSSGAYAFDSPLTVAGAAAVSWSSVKDGLAPHSLLIPLRGTVPQPISAEPCPRQSQSHVMTSQNPAKLTLVLGGARSGKSVFAEGLVTAVPGPWLYIATAQGLDGEMASRIAAHQGRRGLAWETVEAPLELVAALRAAPQGKGILVDCLTLWLSNVMLSGRDVAAEVDDFVDALAAVRGPCVMVSNEVGLGIVPDNALARRFRDEAGRLNHRVAASADRVVFVAAGLPMIMKGSVA